VEHVETYGDFTPCAAGKLTGKMGTCPIDPIVATLLSLEPAFLLNFVFMILLSLFKPIGLFGHEV
jgi:hypothetical protein